MNQPCIVQFGTSRFLQAHVDLFASEAMASGQNVPPIIVVQTTRDPTRAGRVTAFNRPDGYLVVIRGLDDKGAPVDRIVTVRSVVAGLSAARDWGELRTLFSARAAFVVCNTGDRGYVIDDRDRAPSTLAGGAPPYSFPAMLLALLHRRWRAGGEPITLLPCELTLRNGDALKGAVVDLARQLGAAGTFLSWLDDDCRWINTLVDRIVSEPLEPVGAVAEPYALWAIERQPGLRMPFSHHATVLTDDLDRYERLKLYILNLGHSWLAQRWMDEGRRANMTVREALADPATQTQLERLFAEEVVPGFATHGMGEEAAVYAQQTITRFANPYLDHRLADIANDHDAKIRNRVAAFLDWIAPTNAPLLFPQLTALAGQR
jgi:tagaturonate reductase